LPSSAFMKILKYLFLIFVIEITFLFSPAPVPGIEYCGNYVRLNKYMGFLENCDAQGYYDAARYPGHLLRQDELRQSRPLFLLAATIINEPLGYIFKKFEMQRFWGYKLGFLLINACILLGAVLLFEKILRKYFQVSNPKIILGLQLFLISNQVNKAFFWTIHQQLFTILTPLICCYLALKLFYDKPPRNYVYLYAFLGGIGMLVYGNFLLLLPIILLIHFLNSKSVKESFLSLVLFILPTCCWILFLKSLGIKYYNHEVVVYHQLVWIPETLNKSVSIFLQTLKINSIAFIKTFREIVLIMVLALLAVLSSNRTKEKMNFFIIGLVLLCFSGFLWLLGFYQERLTFNLLPILLLFIALGLKPFQNRQIAPYLIFILAASWHVFNLITYGPYS
jgi:hypothetical protein